MTEAVVRRAAARLALSGTALAALGPLLAGPAAAAPPDGTLLLQLAPPPAAVVGSPVLVQGTLLNTSSSAVTGLQLEPAQVGPGLIAPPAGVPLPMSLGPGQAATVVFTLQAVAPGSSSFGEVVDGFRDGAPVSSFPAVAPVTVVAPPTAALTGPAAAPVAGDDFPVTLGVTNTTGDPLTLSLPALAATGPATVTADVQGPQALLPHQTASWTYTVSGAAAGDLQLSGTVPVLDPLAGPLPPIPVSLDLQVQAPEPVLTSVSPPPPAAPLAGGFPLQMQGSGLTDVTAVEFSVAGQIVAVVPVTPSGDTDITVPEPDLTAVAARFPVGTPSVPVDVVAIAGTVRSAPVSFPLLLPATGCAAIGGCASATSTDPAGVATATSPGGAGPISAAAEGTGSISVGRYPVNPGVTPTFSSNGVFFDVQAAPGSAFHSVTLTTCDLDGGNSLQWLDPAAGWQPVSDQVFAAGPPACVTMTVGPSTSPSLAQLGGTVFAVATDPDATTAAPVATETPTDPTPPATPTATATASSIATVFTDPSATSDPATPIATVSADPSATTAPTDPASAASTATAAATDPAAPTATAEPTPGVEAQEAKHTTGSGGAPSSPAAPLAYTGVAVRRWLGLGATLVLAGLALVVAAGRRRPSLDR